jgi:hypothetical protein
MAALFAYMDADRGSKGRGGSRASASGVALQSEAQDSLAPPRPSIAQEGSQAPPHSTTAHDSQAAGEPPGEAQAVDSASDEDMPLAVATRAEPKSPHSRVQDSEKLKNIPLLTEEDHFFKVRATSRQCVLFNSTPCEMLFVSFCCSGCSVPRTLRTWWPSRPRAPTSW